MYAFTLTLSMPATWANEQLKCITTKVLFSFSFLDKVGIHPPYLLKDYSSKHIPQVQRAVPLDLTSPRCFSQHLKCIIIAMMMVSVQDEYTLILLQMYVLKMSSSVSSVVLLSLLLWPLLNPLQWLRFGDTKA